MDWEYIRIWGSIYALIALGATLVWALGYAVYLNRIRSQGSSSIRRLLTTASLVFLIALTAGLIRGEGPVLWTLTRNRLGSAEGQFQTGVIYKAGGTFLLPSPGKAAEAFLRAANQGHTQAQLALAESYFYGSGIARDQTSALRWAQTAAKAGHPLAMVLVGEILRGSTPMEAERFYRQAIPLLKSRGERGDADACFVLGYLYRDGLGVAPDPVTALSWMLVAQRLGVGPLRAYAIQSYRTSLTPDQLARAQAESLTLTKGKT